jgi:transposase
MSQFDTILLCVLAGLIALGALAFALYRIDKAEKRRSGFGHRQIARSCSLGTGTVHDYLKRAEAAGLKWPLPEGWGDEQIEAALLVSGTPCRQHRRSLPDFKNIRELLQ